MTSEHGKYLDIFIEDARQPRDEAKVIQKAVAFIEEHPKSSLLPEVRMKLGQVYFRREDYANAETQFGTSAREAPDSVHAEPALFLAAQCATRLQIAGASAVDRALELFDQVVRRDGPLKLYARQEQATLQTRLSREAEAIALYDLILVAQPPAATELRYAALCGRGDNLVTLGRKELPRTERIEAAVGVFDQLAALPDAPAAWRNQALYKKAKAFELLGRSEQALLAFYEVLEKSAATADREHFWSSKAGFDAARLFETQEQWQSAIGVYEKLAKLGGPRSAEALMRGNQLRLGKFVWE
jgi:tetratricopeptide (TPR) repeat protein